ncbi:uncharacterized protein wu:fa56d06 isoform X1 [Hypomesus transpacificus]|uniref:uncharacterized protein wu:fa56d06 isoform X1 n=1 Tax=Hypomesus transpacificus TaxID=137520 RepID=UPI001F07C2E2|nr:uncharacterized protein wu:fa56d06 isoform X1 [Hypomesus transpacificus]XP_046886509.1 uncharacterized protein wu:fa56d06 isoform X1 [Hypomesus transpacificus]
MLNLVLLCLCALSGLSAAPLRDDVVAPPRGMVHNDQVNLPRRIPAHDHRRQGTEPSRRFLVDLNTGLLKERASEMERRVGHVFEPPSIGLLRQGIRNSPHTPVDRKTGNIIQAVGDIESNLILNSAGSVEEPAKMTESGWVRESVSLPRSVPVEQRRQGTEPSRRFLMDLNSGLLKEHISEMERRVGKVYVPPYRSLFRQGTENSRATLVDTRTGHILQEVGEMERNMKLVGEMERNTQPDVQTKWSEVVAEVPSVPVEQRRQGTEPSRRFLMDLNSGLLKEHISEMERRVGKVYVPPYRSLFRQGTENSRATLVDTRTGHILQEVGEMERNMKLVGEMERNTQPDVQTEWSEVVAEVPSVPVEQRRQGTEPSRRFLMDLNSGLLKEHISEMERRVGKVYVPPYRDLFRQGTENSRATLVDTRTGHILQEVGEMERNFIMEPQDVSRVQDQLDTECVGEVINGRCYHFNPTPMTFSQAEASCRVVSRLGNLASITNSDLHSRLVSMVTKTSNSPVLTWLGGVGKDQKYEWTDGSAWDYTDWMPGHLNTLRDKTACVEMFRVDESWWTSVDCQLKRASICSYPVAA